MFICLSCYKDKIKCKTITEVKHFSHESSSVVLNHRHTRLIKLRIFIFIICASVVVLFTLLMIIETGIRVKIRRSSSMWKGYYNLSLDKIYELYYHVFQVHVSFFTINRQEFMHSLNLSILKLFWAVWNYCYLISLVIDANLHVNRNNFSL